MVTSCARALENTALGSIFKTSVTVLHYLDFPAGKYVCTKTARKIMMGIPRITMTLTHLQGWTDAIVMGKWGWASTVTVFLAWSLNINNTVSTLMKSVPWRSTIRYGKLINQVLCYASCKIWVSENLSSFQRTSESLGRRKLLCKTNETPDENKSGGGLSVFWSLKDTTWKRTWVLQYNPWRYLFFSLFRKEKAEKQ